MICEFCQVGDVPDPKIWASLKSANGSSVNLSAIPKDKPILVVADPRYAQCVVVNLQNLWIVREAVYCGGALLVGAAALE